MNFKELNEQLTKILNNLQEQKIPYMIEFTICLKNETLVININPKSGDIYVGQDMYDFYQINMEVPYDILFQIDIFDPDGKRNYNYNQNRCLDLIFTILGEINISIHKVTEITNGIGNTIYKNGKMIPINFDKITYN